MTKKKDRKRKKQTNVQHPSRQSAKQIPVNNLAKAIQFHQAGNLSEAEVIYRQILQSNPDNADALHLLGVIFHQVGKNDIAVDYISKAIKLNSSVPSFHNNMGRALHVKGNVSNAVKCFREALRLKPDYAEAYNNIGNALKDQGKFDAALQNYQKAIQLNPNYAEAYNNMGNTLKEQGKLPQALESYQRSIQLKPDCVEAYHGLGDAYREQGDSGSAVKYYREAIRLNPDYAESHNNLGNLLKDIGELDAAVKHFEKAIKLKPGIVEGYHNLGNVFGEQGKPDAAIEHYQNAIKNNPDLAEPHNNLGNIFNDQGKIDEAIEHFRKAIQLDSGFAEAHNNLGNALRRQGNIGAADEHFKRAIQLNPESAEIYANLGNLRREQGELDEAFEFANKAVQLNPNLYAAHNNLGNTFKERGKYRAALEHYSKAMQLKPDSVEAHYNRGLVLLLNGIFDEGWPEYEWRFQSKETALLIGSRNFTQPRWDGTSLEGKTILVHSEQGMGDTIQFVRYLPLVKACGGYVICECQKALMTLLDGFPGIDLLIEKPDDGNVDEPFDVYIPLLSLPRIFDTTVVTIFSEAAYLKPRPELVEEWSKRINGKAFKVGIVWAGNPAFKNNRNRSCRLSDFAPLTSISGLELFSLQKGTAMDQLLDMPDGMSVVNLGEQLRDFSDTAAVIANLDLVISVDTSVVHLAGALGKPVWALLAFVPDWRWMLDSEDTPWYPDMRLFRQNEIADWKGVMSRVTDELDKIVNQLSGDKESGSQLSRGKDESVESDKIFLVMPRGIAHGWGVCGRYVASELAKVSNLHYVTNSFRHNDIGNYDQYMALSQCYMPVEKLNGSLDANNRICIDAPVIQAIEGVNFRPWLKEVRGTKTIGYIFFENNILSKDDLKWADDYYDLIAVGSSWCGEVLESHGFSKTKTVIQGIDPALFHKMGSKEKYNDSFVIFSGGKFEFRKGQDLVIRAAKVMQEKYKDVMLVASWFNPWPLSMATMSISSYIKFEPSSKPFQGAMSHILSINGLDENRVILLPSLSNVHMANIYRDSDIGLFPNRCEGGTNLVLMEYMACGRPVIASYLTGHKDVLDEKYAMLINGSSVIDIKQGDNVTAKWDDPDLDEIISQLDWAYHHRDEIKGMGERSAEAMELFTWKDTARAFYNIVSG
ncbi:MAG: tetratricopeptide repeat protein [Candidatus Anammoxibacter sp.]